MGYLSDDCTGGGAPLACCPRLMSFASSAVVMPCRIRWHSASRALSSRPGQLVAPARSPGESEGEA